jgi:hypothetical protein
MLRDLVTDSLVPDASSAMISSGDIGIIILLPDLRMADGNRYLVGFNTFLYDFRSF